MVYPLEEKHLTGLACCQSRSLTYVKVTPTHIPLIAGFFSLGAAPPSKLHDWLIPLIHSYLKTRIPD